MSEEFTPNPPPDDGFMSHEPLEGFDFSGLSPQDVSMPGEPTIAPTPPSKWKEFWGGKKNKNENKPKARKPLAPLPRGGFKKPLEEMYVGIGVMMMPFDPQCAQTIITQAPKCAESLDELAKSNPAVRRILSMLVTTNAWGMVLAAHAPIIMAIMMHHIPSLREKQEKMFSSMVETFANMPREEGE